MSNDRDLISDLVSIVGKEGASGRIFDRVNYAMDAMGLEVERSKLPVAVVRPKSAQEVSGVLEYANKHKIPVYVRGSGVTFKGSPKPKHEGSIILSTTRLISFEMYEDDLYFEVGAGVNQLELEQMLAERGYMLPMNLGSKYSATIGGAVAVNTIGHMVDFCLGKIMDNVMGVEAVLPSGEIIETGTKSIRKPSGVDYTKFLVGTEGLFGVITKIRIRLLPNPKKAYIMGFFKDVKDIAYAFVRVYKEKLPPPLYGELLDGEAARAPFRLRNLGEPKGAVALAITIGHTQEDADWQAREIQRIFKAQGAIEARLVTSKEEQEDLWMCRDNIMNIVQVQEGEEKLVAVGYAECPVPLHHLPDLIDYYRTISHKDSKYCLLRDCKLFIYGHVGTSDLHAMWAAPASWPIEKQRRALREGGMVEKEVYLKWGCAAGEVGQTASRMPFFRERYGEAAHTMLMNVKKAIDPNNILNPGNLEGEGYE